MKLLGEKTEIFKNEPDFKNFVLFDIKESDEVEEVWHDLGKWVFVICRYGVGDA